MIAAASGDELVDRLVSVAERIFATAGSPSGPFDWDRLMEQRPDLADELDPLLILASPVQMEEVLRRLTVTSEAMP